MLKNLLGKVFGNKQARDMRRIRPIIDEINAYFEEYHDISEEELRGKTAEFKQRLADGETLDDLLPEAFAVVKETCLRHKGQSWTAAGVEITWDMVPYDVQMAGGIALHEGRIAEMATGEGKTLVAVAPLYLNALAGRGTHLITVNDYLARRDSEWMAPIFHYLGLTVGCLDSTEPNTLERRSMYEHDITYGTNHEYGFDYLRDNMVTSPDQVVQQRGHFFAIVDEVDNILIDEARTPLIISGPVDRSTHRYDEIKPEVQSLVKKQNELVSRYISEVEEAAKKGPLTRDDGIKLLQVQRGLPKHKRLLKLKSEPGVQGLIEKTELEFIAEKKMHELDEGLYYTVDEKTHQIDITEQGREFLAPTNPKLWELPDIVEEISAIERGDFEVIELVDGNEVLLSGSPRERQGAKKADNSFEIHRHDGILSIPADRVATVKSGTDLDKAERERFKDVIRADNAMQTEKLHNISQMLKAYSLYEKDVEYVVQENKVIIVDEFTGRLMNGRRWSDGLHQAVEAKEGVEIEVETQTLATVTLQNYFRMYGKLSGMTGTAETEAGEFAHTYSIDVMVVPTNRPIKRSDHNDCVYKTKREKYKAVIDEITACHERRLPVLVGTVSVEVSELLSRYLKAKRIPHNVLNAKAHQREAEIVMGAGQPGAVTIATNMAGRGTDIKLHPDVIIRNEAGEAIDGGLQIIGTERHESRRIDRQLRGRAGRQGDPGSSKFFISLEDDLMRLFGSDRIVRIMDRLGLEEGEDITHPLVTRAIESAQKKVESRNFEIRKRTLDYDNVMNKQREAIYGLRRQVLMGEDVKSLLLDLHLQAIEKLLADYQPADKNEPWDITGFLDHIQRHVPYGNFKELEEKVDRSDYDTLLDMIADKLNEAYDAKVAQLGEDLLVRLARYVVLRRIDDNWRDHLLAIDDMRESIGWRGYAQLDPLVEYQKEASIMFEDLMENVNSEVMEHFFLTQPVMQAQAPEQQVINMQARQATIEETLPEVAGGGVAVAEEEEGPEGQLQPQQPVRRDVKVGRNDPCPCGSGKKYKKCHGAAAEEE
jgi:preprotein translocase subunit SecA